MSNNTDSLSVTDFGLICRTCLGEGDMKCLNQKCCEDNCLIEMLLSVTFLQLSEKDGLPFQICLNCEEELTRAYKFATKCSEADKKLRSCATEFKNNLHNKTNVPSNETLKIIEYQEISSENMALKTEFEIEENTDYKVSNMKQELLQNETQHNYSEKQHIEKSTQDEEDQDDSIDNERMNEICINDEKISNESEQSGSEKDNKMDNKWNEDEDGFQGESDESEDNRFDENFPQNENDTIVEKINNKNCDSKEEKQTKRVRKPKIKKLQVNKTFQCKKCYEKFPNSKLLWEHHKTVQHPPNTRITCEICSTSVGWQRMADHMRIHTKEKPYICKFCSKQFSFPGNLSRHINTHTGEKSYKCQYCDKSFTQSTTLKTHVRIHTGERPYICENCGKDFKTNGELKYHMADHESGPNVIHECNVCHRKYKTVGLLKTHMLLHGEKKFLCSDCGQRFLSITALDNHSSVHTGLKRYSCDICGKKLTQISSLRQHQLIHTGVKPHVCKICNRGFTQSQHLKYHMRTHTGEKPYSCKFCGKSFALKGYLIVHTRTHTGETPYLCSVCGKGFYDSSSMKKHKQGHEKQKQKK